METLLGARAIEAAESRRPRQRAPLTRSPRTADDDAVTSALAVPAALTGFLVTGAGGHRPWFPTPRASQEALGRASLDRLRRRMESSP